MRGELQLSISTLLGFLLTLVRVAGVFVFIPLPGVTSLINPARVIFSLAVTIALFPQWPHVPDNPPAGLFALWILVETALGISIGLLLAFISEAIAVGAQVMGLQAGYSFATTIDPNSQADSTVLVVFAQLATGMLFFATGLDREVIRIFARSLEKWPAGSFVLTRGAAEQVLTAGSAMFSTALRLALPMIAVLTMIDISLALLGRINAQLQLLTVAFPVKMIVGLAMLGWLALLLPALFRAGAEGLMRHAGALLGQVLWTAT